MPWPAGQMERCRTGRRCGAGRGRAVQRRHGQRQPDRELEEEENGAQRRNDDAMGREEVGVAGWAENERRGRVEVGGAAASPK